MTSWLKTSPSSCAITTCHDAYAGGTKCSADLKNSELLLVDNNTSHGDGISSGMMNLELPVQCLNHMENR